MKGAGLCEGSIQIFIHPVLKKKKKRSYDLCLVFCVSLNHHFVLNGRIKVNNVWNGMRGRKVQAEFSFLAKFLLITR